MTEHIQLCLDLASAKPPLPKQGDLVRCNFGVCRVYYAIQPRKGSQTGGAVFVMAKKNVAMIADWFETIPVSDQETLIPKA